LSRRQFLQRLNEITAEGIVEIGDGGERPGDRQGQLVASLRWNIITPTLTR
jgi:hypothetical protein